MSDRDFWVGAARRLALRRNVADWAAIFFPAMLRISVAGAVALLAVRGIGRVSPIGPLWWALAGLAALAAVVCAILVARRAYTLPEALARLDEVIHLHNRLTVAYLGVGAWPAPRDGVRDAVRWNWPRLGVPLLIGGLLLAAAALINVPHYTASARPNEEPVAWTQLESWMQILDKAKFVDPPALEKLQEQLDDLRQQPKQDWYSQSSLEAGDALRQQTEQSLHELEANLAKSANLVEQAQSAAQMSPSNLQALSDSMRGVAQSLAGGNLPADSQLSNKLGSFNPSTLKSLSPQQLQELQQRLANGSKICNSCTSPSSQSGNQPGTGDGHRQGKDGQQPSGKPGGGSTAPLSLDTDSENLHTKRLEGSSNADLSQALPGEVIAVTKSKPGSSPAPGNGSKSGGAISSTGAGGDAVWRESLTPDERQVLQKYFK